MDKPAQTSSPRAPIVIRWPLSTCIAFRFAFVYLGLYSLVSQIFSGLFLIIVGSAPNYAFRNLGHLFPLRDITFFVARHVFGSETSLVFTGNSGDSAFYWAQTLWVFVLAAVVTAIWSYLDHARDNYATLLKWFTFFIRVELGAQMLYYGLAKTIPTQFPAPSLVTLVTPVGNVSLQGLLWTSIGASTAYQMFTGVMEVIAGVLLLIPATATFGAAISLTVMAEIVALNLTYDVGLKQISFHLLLLSAFLLAPFAGRIVRAFQGKNVVEREMNLDPIQTSSARSLSPWLHLALGIYLIGMYGYIARSWWYSAGEGATKSPLYGIWNVRRLTVDGVSQPADLNDYDRRWRRVIFDDPGAAVFQRTDDSFARYRASIDVGAQKLELTRSASKTWSSQFMFQRPAEDRMILEGEMDSHQISVELDRVEMDTFRVNNSSFRWVRPPDPNTVSEREISSE